MKTRIGILTVAWVLVVLASNAPAATRNWNNNMADWNWFNPSNWSPVGVPAPADSLDVGNNAQRTPTANAVVTVNGGGIRVFNAGSLATFNKDLYIGTTGPGGMEIKLGGGVASSYTCIGDQSSGDGIVDVHDPGSDWSNSSSVTVGDYGDGRLEIFDQATVSNRAAVLGDRSSGEGVVKIQDSSWTCDGAIHVGKFGTGTMEVWYAGQVQSKGGLIGEYGTGDGTVRLGHTGTKWTSNGNVCVGGDSSGPGGTGLLIVGVSNTASTLKLTSGQVIVWNGTGTLQGGGTIDANVVNRGDTEPGGSIGTLTVQGDYTQMDTGKLYLEVGGDGYSDVLNVTGTLTLDGELVVTLLDGYTPEPDDTFSILSWGSIAGTFDSVDWPDLPPGLDWNDSGLYSSGTVGVVPEPGTFVLLAMAGIGALLFVWRKRRTA